jgi:hypothetical protein
MSVNTTMDGISVQDNRYNLGVTSATHINPDLVEEIRLIVAPVDAETGRGSGQVKILTKSGTNKYTGSAFWNVQNPALNANTWNNNRTGVEPNWYNQQQYSLSFGGPIVKNKTFFFALYEGQTMNSRSLQTATVLTAEARKGNFRFFPGVANGNADQVDTACNVALPTVRVVDVLGNHSPTPLCTTVRCKPSACLAAIPTGRGWTTGYLQRVIASMPLPNYFGRAAAMASIRRNTGGHGAGTASSADSRASRAMSTETRSTSRSMKNINSSNKLTVSFSDDGAIPRRVHRYIRMDGLLRPNGHLV